MNTSMYKQFEKQASAWVHEAGHILTTQEHSFVVDHKKDEFDLATSADIDAETFLRKKIQEQYPDHGIWGEELGSINSTAEYVWIIDPLDCTKEYVKGIGEYNCLLALEHNTEIVVGVIERFGHNMQYVCSKGNGSFLDGKKIHVSTTNDIAISFVGSNIPNKKKNAEQEIAQQLDVLKNFINVVYRIRPGWDDAKLFGWVAQGSLDACISFPNNNKWFDVAPAILLVEEAGGKVTDFEGNKLKSHDVSKGIVVSNGIIHEQILAIIKQTIGR